MSVQYKDYYEILGIDRSASQDEIKNSYRKLVRKFHPDVNKNSNADAKIKEINEAYEVLGDAEKRKRYDTLGSSWNGGDNFNPPPKWGNTSFHSNNNFNSFGEENFSGFSDFFESMFGSQFQFNSKKTSGNPKNRKSKSPPPNDLEAEINLTMEDIYFSVTKKITLDSHNQKQYDFKVPKGITEGSVIRLSGQGNVNRFGQASDLLLKVHVLPHPLFKLNQFDIETYLFLTPWEAALGAKVSIKTLDGNVTLTISPGTQNDTRLRLRGKGLPLKSESGDMYAVVKIKIPGHLTSKEKQLFEELSKISNFNPRE